MGSIIFIYFVDQNLEKNYQEFFRTLVYKAYGSVDQFNLKDEPSSFLSNTSRLLSTSFKGENIEVGNNKLNVLNFNAIPGDGIDDSRAFKKALTIASNFSSILYIPDGKYNINMVLKIPNNTVIQGESENNTILIRDDLSSNNNTMRLPIFSISGNPNNLKNNITITDLTIMGSGSGNTGNCMDLRWVKNYTIKNTLITGCGSRTNDAAIFTKGASDGLIENNVIDKSINGIFSLPSYVNSNNTVIYNNTITNSIKDAIHYRNGTFNKIVNNNIINTSGNGIQIISEDNTKIVNNNISSSNTLESTVGITMDQKNNNILLQNNTIYGGTIGIKINEDKSSTVKSSNISLSGNIVSETHVSCLEINSLDYVIVTNNKFENCNNMDTGSTYGINIGGSTKDVSIINNIITYNGRTLATGIFINGADNVNITHNIVKANPTLGKYGIGINIGPFSTAILIENNDLNDCGCVVKNESLESDVLIRNNTG